MTTPWTQPTVIEQYSEENYESVHVSWTNLSFGADNSISTTGTLRHIARSPKLDITNKTYYITFKGFNFTNLPETISGIELKLRARRSGRITDDTIQLLLDTTVLGDNKADRNLLPEKTYGSETDLWNADISLSDIQDPAFGILLRFQSHPNWPHNDAAFIDAVELRIH